MAYLSYYFYIRFYWRPYSKDDMIRFLFMDMEKGNIIRNNRRWDIRLKVYFLYIEL